MPHRHLTRGESFALAERQANYALQLTGQTRPDVHLDWILDLPKVEVQLAPRYKMDGLAGFTTFTHGRYFIMVNKNDNHTDRRLTLAHEFKHLLDYTAASVIHRALGYGDAARQAQYIEDICDHFAACLLMPRIWLKRAWIAGIQDISALAGLFTVSEEDMEKRLRFLGFLDDGPRPLKSYFRREKFALAA
ncbi:ImmA/IrrE family metallo-endopeptidase [Phytohabitans sp. ZYX-F-186]|uniref:ImmA/IrrE family metallo-endopeptidase n=1 Tax=Phytohabitans maris TaxID=3071409 RepID=A0ABU0Z7R4_9ACTN|nr:ImmA/IrrE family metallo-endopeptidase [Phytohabitans sp. ZYX-F-186]MDQ7903091.1 ImmA/IrrE family metallo-endopeptidase [Phytohabitans sp. ZYX-F-186]